jgi:acyl-CoA thioesterase FadM
VNSAAVRDSAELRLTVQVRRGDIDHFGHVSASRYHEFLVQARAGLIAELLPEASSFVLARVELNHRGEVGEAVKEVEVRVRVVAVGESSFTLDHEVRIPDGIVVAEGSSVLVGWDSEKRGKRVITASERAGLLGHDR